MRYVSNVEDLSLTIHAYVQTSLVADVPFRFSLPRICQERSRLHSTVSGATIEPRARTRIFGVMGVVFGIFSEGDYHT